MSYTLTLPDDLYRALERYAEQQHQTPTEALATLLETISTQNGHAAVTTTEEQSGPNSTGPVEEYLDRGRGSAGNTRRTSRI